MTPEDKNTDKALPLITIGMTCFNAEDTIGAAIDAALEQDWPNIEIVIVDDKSTDSSISVIEKRAEKSAQVKLVKHQENLGYPSALNSIIQHSSGEFVAFFDDDDVSDGKRLQKQYNRITKYEVANGTDMVFCYSNRKVVDSADQKPLYNFYAIGRQAPEPSGSDVADFILWHFGRADYIWGMFGSCTLMLRKDTLEKIGGFDPQFRRNAEWDLAIRGGLQGAHFIAVDEYLITMQKTRTADKAGYTPLKYSLLLREKHKDYLQTKRAYLTSKLVARARFHGGKKNMLRHYFFYVMACVSSPFKLFFPQFIKKIKGRQNV